MGMRRLHTWIVQHDNKWLFVILYILLAVALSIWISLFWLVFVVGVHFVFEVIRQMYQHQRWGRALTEVLWEVKLDLALVIFALALSLYMELMLGIVSVGLTARLAALTRAGRLGTLLQGGLRTGARFAGWQQALRGFLLSVDDLAQVARAFGRRRKNEKAESRADAATIAVEDTNTLADVTLSRWGSWGETWGKGDWIAVGMAAVCLLLILVSPWLTEHSLGSALSVLGEELHPFPGRN
jgi:hypothetical protein